MKKNNEASGRGKPAKKPASRIFTIEQEAGLLNFLILSLSDKSRSTVKSILSNRQVAVNGKIVTQFDTVLHPGDVLTVNMEKGARIFSHPKIDIVYEDNELIVVNKHSGLLSVSTDNVKDKTAYHILSAYLKSVDVRNRIFVLHRLDRETSGLMMFAKNRRVQEILQKNWSEMVLERAYVAVVEGRPANTQGRITSYLRENKAMNVYSANDGQLAITHYNVLKSNERYTLVKLQLETGRKNQIRVHLSEMGCPVAGDTKYGARSNPIKRLALHACGLKFIHPETQQVMDFQTEVPKRFGLLVKQRGS